MTAYYLNACTGYLDVDLLYLRMLLENCISSFIARNSM